MNTFWMRASALGLAFSSVCAAGAAAYGRTHDLDLRETIAPGDVLEVVAVSGSIGATAASGDTATIHARVTSDDIDPARVTLREERSDGRVRICAVIDNARSCDGGHNDGGHDFSVDFTVGVPARARLTARTVSGDVRATGLHGDVSAATVNGDVTLATDGRADAQTVNGSIDVHLARAASGPEERFRTVSGSIHLTVPRNADIAFSAETLSGSIRGEGGLPVALRQGDYVGHYGTATLGGGNRRVSAKTLSGDISLGFN